MFRISAFSMLSKIPLKTLRYYDQIGILKPVEIDEATRYRYYAAEQLFEANRILMYKELGFTLQQIAQLLQEEISSEQIQGMFKLKEAEIRQQLESEQLKLKRIKERMNLIATEGCVEKEQEVVIKAVKPQRIVSYQSTGTTEDIPALFGTLHQLLENNHCAFITEPQIVLWSESNKEDVFEFEVGYAVKQDSMLIPDNLYIRALPEETSMATLLFRSDSPRASTACVDLALWIERNGYQIKKDQPGREVYLPISEGEAFQLIEIQIPIEDGNHEK